MLVWSNLRYAVSSLRSAPGIALALIFTIAVGVGSNAAVFGFARGLLFALPPISDAANLVAFYHRTTAGEYAPWSFDEYERLSSTVAPAIRGTAAERESHAFIVADAGGGSAPLAEVTASFFAVVGVEPALGAMPVADSDSTGVVISVTEWRRDFNARDDVIGAKMQVDGRAYRVAAVAPEGFDGLVLGRPIDVWVVLDDKAFGAVDRDAHMLTVVGRLAPGRTLDEVARMASDAEVLRYSPIEPAMRTRVDGIGALLLIAVAFVFVVACANLVALLLSLAASRSAPLSIRVALGASRSALAQQLIADTVVLAVVGAAAGWLLALWTSHLIPALLFAEDAERLRFDPSAPALVAASLVTLVFMLACSLAPMVSVPHRQPMAILRRTADRLTDTGGPLRAGLVIAQMALSSILLISSARLLEDVNRSLHTDLGDRVAGLAIATVQASSRFASPDEGMWFFAKAKDTVDHLAGVGATAWVQTLPGGRTVSSRYRIAPAAGGHAADIDVTTFDPRAFSKARLRSISGRLFGGGDTPRGCKVAVVNEEGERAWFDGDAVGRSLTDTEGHRIDVVGVVPAPTDAAAGHARPLLYLYAPQTPDPPGVVRRLAMHVSAPFSGAIATLQDNIASDRYFELLGLAPIGGWIPQDADGERMCSVAVVNVEASDRYFAGAALESAVVDESGRRIEISAVTPSGAFRALQPPAQPMIYRPAAQAYSPVLTLVARTDVPDERLLDEIRKRVNSLSGSGGVSRPERLDRFFGRTSMASERITSALVGVCALLALMLALVGVSGVIADSVSRRTREFGLKSALGARGWHILGPLAWEGMKLAAAGAVAGVVISFFAIRALDRVAQAATVSAGSVLAWIAVPVALVSVSALATLLPARRAVRVDPLVVMKAVDS